jgi:hypothetical protein
MTIGLGRTQEISGTAAVSAGDTTKVVTHGIGYTPDLNRINIEPLEDWGGRGHWLSDATSTQFTLNIEGADLEDLSFKWQYVEGL